jgi:cytochrome c biogenesis protein CcdA
MSLLPLTLGYLSGSNTRSSNTELVLNSAVYAIGLASVLSLFGLSAAFLGQVQFCTSAHVDNLMILAGVWQQWFISNAAFGLVALGCAYGA